MTLEDDDERTPLAVDVRAYVARCESAFPADFASHPLAAQRAMYRDLCKAFDRPRPVGVAVRDETLAADHRPIPIPIRIYHPRPGQPLPGLVYFHGGGWIYGDLDSHDTIAAEIAAAAEVAVVAVDYRLAPEHPFPAAFEDAWAAVQAIARRAQTVGLDPARLAVGGDSAGGNLAAAVCLEARGRPNGPRPVAQVLIYPALGLDVARGEAALAPSAPCLAREDLRLYWQAYLGAASIGTDARAAPLLSNDYRGLPPTYIAAAAHDPLLNDSRVYTERLRAAGVPVDLDVHSGLVHGFLRARHCTVEGEAAFAALCRAVHRLLRSD